MMKLHHTAFKITIGSSRTVQKFCENMGATLVWEGHDQGREISMQFDNDFRIQFSEIDEAPHFAKNKHETHLAFLSDDPKRDVVVVENWFKENGVKTRPGQWSEREQWLDCPEVFIDFVVEIFNKKT